MLKTNVIHWNSLEIAVLKAIGPFLSNTDTATILNALFNTERTHKSVWNKLNRLGTGRTTNDPEKAIESANKCKELSARTKNNISELLLPYIVNHTAKETVNSNMVVNNNRAVLEKNTTENPQTIEALLRVCEIDEDVWMVDRYVVNVREQISKTKNGIVTIPLYQIKAWLAKKDPVTCRWPTISPIDVKPFVKPTTPVQKKSSLQKALIIPDSQNSYRRDARTGYLDPTHDRFSWDIVCQIAEEEKPEVIVLLGDMLDLPDWSDKFLITPDLYFTTQPALLELHWWLRRLAATGAHIVYLEGNHEDRLARSVATNTLAAYQIRPANAPQAPPALSIDGLLGLQELGVEYVAPYKTAEYWLNDNLRISHGHLVRSGSGNTVSAAIRDSRCSEIFGHIHRIEMATKTVWSKNGAKQYVAASPGTISRLDPGIVPSNTGRQNWQNGFGIVEFEEGNGLFDIRLVQIIQGKAVYNGRMWEGIDRVKEIARDTEWNAFLPPKK